MLILTLLIFMIGTVYGNTVCIEVPAVTESGTGALVNMCTEDRAGTGKLFVSINPPAGEIFQESILASYIAVSSQIDLGKRDFIVSTDAQKVATSLDGPSAGTALGIMMRAITENKSIRNDVTITGGLDQENRIISVGALPEKVEIAYLNNKKAILLPPGSLDDKIVIYGLSKKMNINASEYDNFDYAYRVFTENRPVKWNVPVQEPQKDNAVESLDTVEYKIPINATVYKMLVELNNSVNGISSEYPEWYPYFYKEYNTSYALYRKGYIYSAGNKAFLALYRSRMLLAHGNDPTILEKEVISCNETLAKELREYNGSIENYATAELRYYWIQNEFRGYKDNGYSSNRILRIGSLEKAIWWCNLARSMLTDNDTIAENYSTYDLKQLDEELLALYENGQISEHLIKARDAYNNKLYGAALLEIVFHESFVNDTYDELLENYTGKRRWTQTLIAHSHYLNASSEYDKKSSQEIARHAYFLDIHLDSIIEKKNIPQIMSRTCEEDEFYTLLNLVLIFTFAVIIILVLKMR